MTVSYEFGVVNYTSSLSGKAISMPSLTATFPLSPSGSLTVYQSPTTLHVAGSAWSSPLNHSKTLTQAETFATGKNATLSTQKIAVMSPTSYGTLTLEFRWRWFVTPPTGSLSLPQSSSWTVPSLQATSPYLPSIFYPAPSVTVVATSANPAVSGSTFNMSLSGAVANTSFRIVVEYPSNGTEITSRWEATPTGASTFVATANLTLKNGNPLPAANYLIHVHDACQAIIKNISLTVSAAPHPAPPGFAYPAPMQRTGSERYVL